MRRALGVDDGLCRSGPCDKTTEPSFRLSGPCDTAEVQVFSLKEVSSDEFKAGMRVEHNETGRVGTVQAGFPGTGSFYEPWEVPVLWDGDKYVSGVLANSLKTI